MEDTMKNLYTQEGVQQLHSRAEKALRAAVILGAVCLAGCIALCFGIRTRNAETRQLLVIALSTAGSWGAVCLWAGIRIPALREASHEEGVLKEAAEAHTGEILQVGEAYAIPKSIAFRTVTLREGEEEVPLKLNDRAARGFPAPGRLIRTETRRGYITAWEAADE